MLDYEDRLRGIAVGAVIGDALGMPLEFHPPRPVFDLVTEMEEGPLPAGTFTDDTEMALALAESLLIANPLDGQDLAGRLTAWYQNQPSDIGFHTSKVLNLIANGTPWHEAPEIIFAADPDSSSNGSLMRSWPLAIARWENPSLLVAETKLQAEVTHLHSDSIHGAILVNLIIQKLIHRRANTPPGAAIRQAVASSVQQVNLSDEFRLAVDLAPVRTRDDLKNTGWVVHTVESSLWAVLTTRSFEEALVHVVNLGWDADSSGSVTGAIAGALYGLSGIPSRWQAAIHGEYPLCSGHLWFINDIIKLADQLANLSSKT
ncbi:MAG: ADP-ribosylglycohydrolase family protein [Chloroflexi bacterium]|nr:ADP-ribosylglycohydrolase family protein [Chloroflexota bacterium]